MFYNIWYPPLQLCFELFSFSLYMTLLSLLLWHNKFSHDFGILPILFPFPGTLTLLHALLSTHAHRDQLDQFPSLLLSLKFTPSYHLFTPSHCPPSSFQQLFNRGRRIVTPITEMRKLRIAADDSGHCQRSPPFHTSHCPWSFLLKAHQIVFMKCR